MNDYMTLDEAVEFLSTPRSTMYRWLREGKVPGHKLGRQWRFLRTELEDFRSGDRRTESERAVFQLPGGCRAPAGVHVSPDNRLVLRSSTLSCVPDWVLRYSFCMPYKECCLLWLSCHEIMS